MGFSLLLLLTNNECYVWGMRLVHSYVFEHLMEFLLMLLTNYILSCMAKMAYLCLIEIILIRFSFFLYLML